MQGIGKTFLEIVNKHPSPIDCIGVAAIVARTIENNVHLNYNLMDMGFVEKVQQVTVAFMEKYELKPSSYWVKHDWVETIEKFTENTCNK